MRWDRTTIPDSPFAPKRHTVTLASVPAPRQAPVWTSMRYWTMALLADPTCRSRATWWSSSSYTPRRHVAR